MEGVSPPFFKEFLRLIPLLSAAARGRRRQASSFAEFSLTKQAESKVERGARSRELESRDSAAGDDSDEFDPVALANGPRIPFFAVQGQAVVLD